jgi:hypothetical protein
MAKKHTLTALLTAAYVIIMITIMLANVNIAEDGSFEKFYDDNGGLIWACTAIFGVVLFVNTYLDVVAAKEKKQSIDKTIELQKTIVGQNNKSLEIQTDHIKEFAEISKQLNRNYANDNKAVSEINKLDKKFTSFVNELKNKDDFIDKRFESIEAKLEKHIEKHN